MSKTMEETLLADIRQAEINITEQDLRSIENGIVITELDLRVLELEAVK